MKKKWVSIECSCVGGANARRSVPKSAIDDHFAARKRKTVFRRQPAISFFHFVSEKIVFVEKCDVKIEHAKLRSPQCQLILRSEIRSAVSTRAVINIEIFAQFSIQLRLSSSSGCEISKVLQASFRATTAKSFTMQEDVCWCSNLVVRRSHVKLKQLKTFRMLSVAAANPSSDLRSPASHQIFLQSWNMRREICYIIILNWS